MGFNFNSLDFITLPGPPLFSLDVFFGEYFRKIFINRSADKSWRWKNIFKGNDILPRIEMVYMFPL